MTATAHISLIIPQRLTELMADSLDSHRQVKDDSALVARRRLIKDQRECLLSSAAEIMHRSCAVKIFESGPLWSPFGVRATAFPVQSAC